jgi:hypothetical protein
MFPLKLLVQAIDQADNMNKLFFTGIYQNVRVWFWATNAEIYEEGKVLLFREEGGQVFMYEESIEIGQVEEVELV